MTQALLPARRYAARSRILVAMVGLVLIGADRSVAAHPRAAALGLAVILASGVIEAVSHEGQLLRFEEAFSCLAGVLIVGFGAGRVTAITVLWLVAAAVGVLARGGRVGPVGRVLVVGTLLSPLVTQGGMSATAVGLALGTILLLLSVGRLSRELVELLRRAQFDADHDTLTGTLAPPAFRRALDAAAAAATQGAPLAVVLVDIDGLGHLNKGRGHAAGDAAIAHAVAALRACSTPGDLLARIDGDCFALTSGEEDPLAFTERIRAQATDVALSIGVAQAPRDGEDAEALLGAADVALRIAKRTGRARSVLYEGEPLTVTGPTGARGAIERLLRGEGLEMAVQPIVDIRDGTVHAYEALARFRTRGGQGPLHWLSLAEELGLRTELELACLRAALDLLPELPAGPRLTVNLSAPVLSDPRAVAIFAACPSLERLVIEVTEEALAREDTLMDEAIVRIRAQGTEFAVDDIGAGYSGLRQLATLQPTYLKLDRGLVTGLHQDPGRASLVAAMADYALATGALLVAEGVETEAELDALRSIGVPLVQGFLLGRPGPPWPQPTGVSPTKSSTSMLPRVAFE